MRTQEQIISALTQEQRQLLADTINFGYWGTCDAYFQDGPVNASGYITDMAYMGGHFERRTLNNRFRSLLRALGLTGDRRFKQSPEMQWQYDWWQNGSGSVLFIREDLAGEFEQWAKNNP